MNANGLKFIPDPNRVDGGTYSIEDFPRGKGTTSTCYYYGAAGSGLVDPYEDPNSPLGTKGYKLDWEGLQLLINSGLKNGTLSIHASPKANDLVLWTNGGSYTNAGVSATAEQAFHAGVVINPNGNVTRSKLSLGPVFTAPCRGFSGTPIYIGRP
jgi:hypothetical protein